MPSIIEGYSYDVFISYRQKDNKHDGWVTEFVNQLKGELEATFKEDISIYFDENPHDGLLETHSVDKSLEDKLKCLIFIPIISQTYCDPKSFAWQHEFCAFNKLAKEDKFGRDIKLSSGNVASRILPIKIHDLDPEDKALLENEIGGVLRSIEFIYKSAGVNRPLRANEDHPQDNLNRTYYRDQINKVANAIKEIITALKRQSQHTEDVVKKNLISESGKKKSLRTMLFAGSAIALVLITFGILFIPKFIKPNKQIEKSIAVLPFKLLSNEPDKQYLADGMMDAITLHLSKIKELRVLGRTSSEQYRNPTKTLSKIGNELGVNYLLEGSFQKSGDNVRLIVQLIKTGKEGHVWANEYDRNWKEVFSVQSEVAQSIASELKAAITPEEKKLIENTPTSNLAAYDFYQRGKEEYYKYWVNSNDVEALGRAEFLYNEALEHDPKFAPSYTGLARINFNKNFWKEYFNENFLDSVLVLCDLALSFDKNDYETHIVIGNVYRWRGVTKQALEEYNQALRINPNSWEAYYGIGQLYYYSDLIKKIENTLKAASLNHGTQLPVLFREIADAYRKAGFPEESNYYVKEAFKLDGDSVQLLVNSKVNVELLVKRAYKIDSTSSDLLYAIGSSYLSNKQYKESLVYFKKYLNRILTLPEKNEQHGEQFTIFSMLGYAYLQNGDKKEGEYYINKQIQYTLNEIRLVRLRSLYDYYDLAGLYAYRGDTSKAYENLKVFIQKNSYITFWHCQSIKINTFFDNIRNKPEFQQIVKEMESKYQAGHERVRKWLKEQGTL